MKRASRTGVKRALDRTLNVPLNEGTYVLGEAFEHFIIIELIRLSRYRENDWTFSYLRTMDDAEIDLVIERPRQERALVEIKSSVKITDHDVATLNRFAKDLMPAQQFCLSRDLNPKKIGSVECLPWQE